MDQQKVRRPVYIGRREIHNFLMENSLADAVRILNNALANLESPFVIWLGHIATVHLTKVQDIEVRSQTDTHIKLITSLC